MGAGVTGIDRALPHRRRHADDDGTTANAYNGDTNIDDGILAIGTSSALDASSRSTSPTAASSTSTASAYPIRSARCPARGRRRSGGAIVNASGTNTLSGPITLSGSSAAIERRRRRLTISGVIGGTASLTLGGGNTLTLTNFNNTYSGGTTIAAGTTVAAGSDSLGSGAVTDEGELDLDDTTLTNDITLDSTGNAIVAPAARAAWTARSRSGPTRPSTWRRAAP